MQAYVVRHIAEEPFSPHEIVGIFVARSLDELRYLVDQCSDTPLCEYRPLGAGGIMWEGRGPRIPMTVQEDSPASEAFKGASFDERWGSVIDGHHTGDWRFLEGRSAREQSLARFKQVA